MMHKKVSIKIAAKIIYLGGVIAYPTESVWGLGCDPFNKNAVNRLLEIKNRTEEKGLIVITSNINHFNFILQYLPHVWKSKLHKSWPSFNTWLIPNRDIFPKWITGRHKTVALRVTNHYIVKRLCGITGPIVSTSANPTGHDAAKSLISVQQYFDGKLDAILLGKLGTYKTPSVIRDLRSGKLIR